ncbi:hypothetical protein FA13DRAFT_58571 [Coprinellus micaceus]|uniref:RNI-like protein n=1 Tax=Coprinellus micaceus TaxID=71717 RepID=A0A4Y7U173_COPMI|nr:hypothetical protein FA13DRAFT_58571 [Coprinellus micaceus]
MRRVSREGLSLPKLRTLQIHQVNAWFLVDLEVLDMPTLQECSILLAKDDWVPFDVPGGDMDATVDVYLGSCLATLVRGDLKFIAQLQTLRITNGIFPDDTLLDILRDLYSLKHLTLDNVIFDEELFTKLLTPSRHLPQLRTLNLLNVHVEFVGLGEFVKQSGVELSISRCSLKARCGCSHGRGS